MIKMFMPKFLNSLPQPPRNNPRLARSTNTNFKTRFHQQCDYLLGFQTPKRISDSIFKGNGQETNQIQRMIYMKHQHLHTIKKWTSWWRPI